MAMIEVYKATSAYGSSCLFSTEPAARAWAGTNGTVERTEVHESVAFIVVGNQCQHGHLARVCEMCDKDHEILRLTGEAAVLRSLLRECDAVLAIVEPYTDDEAKDLARLRQQIGWATGDAKGTLL